MVVMLRRNPYAEWNADRETAFAAIMKLNACGCNECAAKLETACERLRSIESTPQALYGAEY